MFSVFSVIFIELQCLLVQMVSFVPRLIKTFSTWVEGMVKLERLILQRASGLCLTRLNLIAK